MTACSDIELDTNDEVLYPARLYRNRRDFVMRQGDAGGEKDRGWSWTRQK